MLRSAAHEDAARKMAALLFRVNNVSVLHAIDSDSIQGSAFRVLGSLALSSPVDSAAVTRMLCR
jgi:hypothetical protein